jgi:CheY-like chemotaxis protein
LLLGNSDDTTSKPAAPKVVLLDLRLQRMNNLEVLRRIGDNEQTRKLPVVAMISSNDDRDVNAAYELGVNSFIDKPIEFEEFAEVSAKLGCTGSSSTGRHPEANDESSWQRRLAQLRRA